MQLNRNDLYVQHARRLLQERGPDPAGARAAEADAAGHAGRHAQAARAVGAARHQGLTRRRPAGAPEHETDYIRSWAIDAAGRGRAACRTRRSAVRGDGEATMPRRSCGCTLASAMQRVPAEKRWDVVAGLLSRSEDASDHNLPLMVWYAAEPTSAARHAARPDGRGRLEASAAVLVHRPACRGARHPGGAAGPDRSTRPDGRTRARTNWRPRAANRIVEALTQNAKTDDATLYRAARGSRFARRAASHVGRDETAPSGASS